MGCYTCYREPELLRELTRTPAGSFSFLACTLFSLNLINALLVFSPIKVDSYATYVYNCRTL